MSPRGDIPPLLHHLSNVWSALQIYRIIGNSPQHMFNNEKLTAGNEG
jgi:hypothetical protein